MRVYVTLQTNLMGKVCGLCGNYDGKGENDFRARSGQVEDSPLAFANSWRVRESCPYVTDPPDPCFLHPEREHWAEYACNILRTSMFAECIDVVSAFSCVSAKAIGQLIS